MKEQQKIAKDVERLRKKRDVEVQKRNVIEAGLNKTKTLDELEKQKATLERQIEENKRVKEDENTSLSEREAAQANLEEREKELAMLREQVKEREEALPLRERVENIFKKKRLDTAGGCSACWLSHRCSGPCCNECHEKWFKGREKWA